ncbi:MAG: hypothetical protein DHS20C20_03410 [Ardenticatenaceae bacterium]|nr:MAG: hypothetical protein DHS20C20_03410 [Ardenticatenaceae bacterium]
MILTFKDWLANQEYRKDAIGELARVPSLQNPEFKSSRRKHDEHKSWAAIVVNIASPGLIEVFNDAWQEYLLAKQAAESSLE